MVPVLIIICVLPRALDAALRVFGDRDVDPQEYPYVVRLEMKIITNDPDTHLQYFSHLCTASVLTPIWTLTAGHCINFEQFTSSIQAVLPAATIKYIVRYGSTTAFRSTFESFSEIIRSVKHPAFKMMSSTFGDLVSNDVGLVKTMPIKLYQYGKLSAVEYHTLVGHKAVAMGYGLMQEGENEGNTLALGKTLQALDVLIISCMKDITKGSPSPIICLSRKCRHPAFVCKGDSGGPLIHFSRVVGINHMGFSPDCSLQNTNAGVSRVGSNIVGVITPIGPYIEWIADQIRSNEVT